MMSLQAIADLSRQQAVRAAAHEIEPYAPADPDEPFKWNTFPFPNIGDYRPNGWCLVDTAFCDKTGWDNSGPAMSADALRIWVSERVQIEQDKGYRAGFALVEEGQFQLYVGYFTDNPDVVAACDDNREEYEIVYCDVCDEPYEKDENDSACPWCGYDPDECPECGCNPCECPPFGIGDKVVYITTGGERIEGTVWALDDTSDELTIETPEGKFEIEIPWDEVQAAYNPLDDPNQIILPLDL
jgi:hypothetical protein